MMEVLLANWQPLLGGLAAVLIGVVAILKIIPGNQGENMLSKVAGWLKKLAGR